MKRKLLILTSIFTILLLMVSLSFSTTKSDNFQKTSSLILESIKDISNLDMNNKVVLSGITKNLSDKVSKSSSIFGKRQDLHLSKITGNDVLTETKVYEWAGTDWVESGKILYSYDSNNNNIEMLETELNGTTWENDSKVVITYVC